MNTKPDARPCRAVDCDRRECRYFAGFCCGAALCLCAGACPERGEGDEAHGSAHQP